MALLILGLHPHSHTSYLSPTLHKTLSQVPSTMNHQGYIRIEEDDVAPSPPKTIFLRNIAATPALPRNSSGMTRAQVLNSLVPLSAKPWGSTPSMISGGNQSQAPSQGQGQGQLQGQGQRYGQGSHSQEHAPKP